MITTVEGRALVQLGEAARGAEIRSLVGGIFRLIELLLLVAILVCVW